MKFIVHINRNMLCVLNSEERNGLDTSAEWTYQEGKGKSWKEKYVAVDQLGTQRVVDRGDG